MERILHELLENVRSGTLTVDDAARRLSHLAFEDLGFAQVDHHRRVRRGFPEVVLAEGKSNAQTEAIVERLLAGPDDVLVTRASPEVASALARRFPGAVAHELARTVHWTRGASPRLPGHVLVMTAGTSDVPVAEEAAITAEVFGNDVGRLYDVGVAGLHRLLARGEEIRRATVLIVVAGMEGALPSVVGGLTRVPVIAVPTSTGYGASFGGIAALLAMLNSCASGVTVVNIDNGFGAAFAASLVNGLLAREPAAQ
jgi:NCAIR mutase (PurE)-related protein